MAFVKNCKSSKDRPKKCYAHRHPTMVTPLWGSWILLSKKGGGAKKGLKSRAMKTTFFIILASHYEIFVDTKDIRKIITQFLGVFYGLMIITLLVSFFSAFLTTEMKQKQYLILQHFKFGKLHKQLLISFKCVMVKD